MLGEFLVARGNRVSVKLMADALVKTGEEYFNVCLISAKVDEHFLISAFALRLNEASRMDRNFQFVMPRPIRSRDPRLELRVSDDFVWPSQVLQRPFYGGREFFLWKREVARGAKARVRNAKGHEFVV